MANCGNTVQKIGGAIERIDDPGVGLVGAFAAAAFFAEKAIAAVWPSSIRRAASPRRGGRRPIRNSPGPFNETCSFSSSPKSRLRAARGLARGGDHDIEQSGMLHGACGLPVMARVVKGGRAPRSTAISWRPCRRRRALPAFACRRTRRDPGRSRRRPSQSCAI